MTNYDRWTVLYGTREHLGVPGEMLTFCGYQINKQFGWALADERPRTCILCLREIEKKDKANELTSERK